MKKFQCTSLEISHETQENISINGTKFMKNYISQDRLVRLSSNFVNSLRVVQKRTSEILKKFHCTKLEISLETEENISGKIQFLKIGLSDILCFIESGDIV